MFLSLLLPFLLQFVPSEILSSPVVVGVFALLAIVGDSFVSALLLRGVAKGLKPQTVVYAVSGLIVLLAMFVAGVRPPIFDMLNPAMWITGLLLITAAWAEATKFLYDVLLKRFWHAPEPLAPVASR